MRSASLAIPRSVSAAGKERSAAAKVDAVAARMGLGRCSPKTKPRPSESCLTPETNELHELRSLLDQEKQVAQAFRWVLFALNCSPLN